MTEENKVPPLYTLADYIRIFIEKKNFILISTIIVAIFAVIYAFFIAKPIFLSNGIIKTTNSSSGLAGLLGAAGGIGDLGDLGELTGGGSSAKELALYESILYSRRCVEETIIKFDLNKEWEYKYMFDAVKNFRTNVMEIQKDRIAGTMEIGVYDENPERAKEIADFLIYQLNKINAEMNVLNAKNNREFIQARYNETQEQLKKAEDSLRYFQDIHGVSPDILVKAAVQTQVQLEAEIKSEEIKLDILRKILSPDQAEVLAQEEKIKALNLQLANMENTNISEGTLNLKGSPEVVIDFLRLQRNVEIQNKILTFILPIFEQSKIEEKRETPSVIVLDNPNVPDKKAKPKRMYIVLGATAIFFVFIFAFFVVKRKWDDYKKRSLNI